MSDSAHALVLGGKATHEACKDLDGCCMRATRALRKAERELAQVKPLEWVATARSASSLTVDELVRKLEAGERENS